MPKSLSVAGFPSLSRQPGKLSRRPMHGDTESHEDGSCCERSARDAGAERNQCADIHQSVKDKTPSDDSTSLFLLFMGIDELRKQPHEDNAIFWRQRFDQQFLRAVNAFLQVVDQVEPIRGDHRKP